MRKNVFATLAILMSLAFFGWVFLSTGAAQTRSTDTKAATQDETQKNQTQGTPSWTCPGMGFIDRNGDGICDRIQGTTPRAGMGPGMGRGMGRMWTCPGMGFIDQNGDGICDRIQGTTPPAQN